MAGGRRLVGCGLALVVIALVVSGPGLLGVAGWGAVACAVWPVTGLAAAMAVLGGRRWVVVFALQCVVVGAATAASYGTTWWFGLLLGVAVASSARVTTWGMSPGEAPLRRYREDEVDAYHAVTAVSGALGAALTVAAVALEGASAGVLAMVGLVVFVSATTSQLVILPFVLRPMRLTSLSLGAESWGQRTLLLVASVVVFAPGSSLHLSFVLFPILGWAAIRAADTESHLQVLVVSLVSCVATLVGSGPFTVAPGEARPGMAALLVVCFIASFCYLLIPLALTVKRLTAMTRQADGAATTLNRMLDSATGTVFIGTDSEGFITHYNGGAQQALGYLPQEVLGRRPEMFHTPAEVARQAAELRVVGFSQEHLHIGAVHAQVQSGVRRDWEFVRSDGEKRMVSLSISKITTAGGAVAGYIASGEDITERLRAQRALDRAFTHEQDSAQALRQADAVKQELVSTVSHELRTPITNIVGYVEMLGDGMLGEIPSAQADVLDRIERNSIRLQELVDDLLLHASAESEHTELDVVDVDLGHVVARAHAGLSVQIARRDLRLEIHYPETPVVVRGDATLLERAVTNVWSNAVKFTPDGGSVTVTVGQPAPGLPGHVRVEDSGMGIDGQDLENVFNPFFRTAEAGRRAVQGSGLGLSIVRTIMARHRGDVTLRSTPGVGTEVVLAVPGAAPGTGQPFGVAAPEIVVPVVGATQLPGPTGPAAPAVARPTAQVV